MTAETVDRSFVAMGYHRFERFGHDERSRSIELFCCGDARSPILFVSNLATVPDRRYAVEIRFRIRIITMFSVR